MRRPIVVQPPQWTPNWVSVFGIAPSIAMDFVNNRYYGAALTDINTTRAANHTFKDAAGNALTFSANTVRRSDLGLYYTTDDTMVITGPLAAAIQGTQGTLLVETGVSEVVYNTFDITTGGNNTVIIGGVGASSQMIYRGGNGALAGTYNGVVAASASNAPGNGRSFDTAIQSIALRWDGSGNRSISNGGGTLSNGTGGLAADRSTVYIGRQSAGNIGSGLIRSIRYFPALLSDQQMMDLSYYGPTETKFAIWGDSTAAGSGVASPATTSWRANILTVFNPRATVYVGAVSGETTPQALAHVQADTDLRHREWINLIWSGHNDAAASDTDLALQAITNLVSGERKYCIFLPIQNTSNAVGSAGYQKILDIRSDLRRNYPLERTLDIPALFARNAAADANIKSGYTPSTMLFDTIHPNQTGQDLIYPEVKARCKNLGWAGYV